MTSTTQQVRKVAVLGANGAMGSGGGELFAADGIETTFLARDHEKAREGLERAQSMAKSERRRRLRPSRDIRPGSRGGRSRCRPHLRSARRGVAAQAAILREGRPVPPPGLDRRNRLVGVVDCRDGGGAQRQLPPQLSRYPPLQSPERHHGVRGHPARRDRSRGGRIRRAISREAASAARSFAPWICPPSPGTASASKC